MAITTASQSQLGQETAKNSQIVTQSVKLVNSGGGAAVGPNITSIIVTDSGYNTLDDTAAATSNSYIKIIGTGFQSTANVFLNGTMVPTANVTFISSTELRAVLPVSNTGNYAVSVYNSNSSGALYSSSFVISTMPQWLTSATLANVTSNTVFSNTLVATSDSSVTYSNTTILPTGTILLSNGYFYGNVSVGVDTTYSFDVKATDAQNQDTTRTFSLTALTGYVVEYLVVAGGGGASGGQGGVSFGAGGAGGTARTGSVLLSIGTPLTVTVGTGGGGSGPGGSAGNPGSNSSLTSPGTPTFTAIIATGGGGGGGTSASWAGGSNADYTGGSRNAPSYTAGGGAGAGQNGSPGVGNPGGAPGGNGITSSITGTSVSYGGGGGSGGYGVGGAGGGGTATYSPTGTPGTANRGGGGGSGEIGTGGNGGSGIVILSIPTPSYPGSAPGATVTTPPAAPGKTILTYNSPGTFTA